MHVPNSGIRPALGLLGSVAGAMDERLLTDKKETVFSLPILGT